MPALLQAFLRLVALKRLGVLLFVLAATLCASSTASALEPTQTKTCVWGFDFAEHNSDGLLSAATHGKHQGNRAAPSEVASGSLLAAEALPAAENELVVLGRQVDTAVAKDWPGHQVLDIPDWTLAKNDAWVQSAIDRNANVYLASPQNASTLFDAVAGRQTVFARELGQFLDAGYRQSGDYLIPPVR